MNYQEFLRRAGMSSDGVDMVITAGWGKIGGRTQTIGGVAVRVILRDNAGDVLLATGTTVPTATGSGYAKGAIFIKTNVVTGNTGHYVNIGTSASKNFVKLGDLYTAKVSLTNANIKNLRATPITLVAAPGANLMLEFVSAILVNNGGANAITESADNLAVKYTDGSGVQVSQDIEATGFIDQTAKTATNALAKINTIVATANGYNKALVLHNTGDGEYAGNAAADVTMDVWTSYRILDVA